MAFTNLNILAPGTPAAPELLQVGTTWTLLAALPCYGRPRGQGLATEAAAGRQLTVTGVDPAGAGRLGVRRVEDGYPGWIDPDQLLGQARASSPRPPQLWGSAAIRDRLDSVLAFAEAARQRPNHYLWGGSLGPDYDCSGFTQAAFAQAGIWIPRDAYQQERFCQPLAVRPGTYGLLQPGDLIFFGLPTRCTHVGLHLGQGRYLHSSGREHGHNGLAINSLDSHHQDAISRHYRQELRGAGRVQRCHDGTTLA